MPGAELFYKILNMEELLPTAMTAEHGKNSHDEVLCGQLWCSQLVWRIVRFALGDVMRFSTAKCLFVHRVKPACDTETFSRTRSDLSPTIEGSEAVQMDIFFLASSAQYFSGTPLFWSSSILRALIFSNFFLSFPICARTALPSSRKSLRS